MAKPLSKKLSLLIVSAIVLVLLMIRILDRDSGNFQQTTFISRKVVNALTTSKPLDASCTNVSLYMTRGDWKSRPLTKKENIDITAFLKHASARYRFPENYQRKDKLCGNVTHSDSYPAGIQFRALCDPRGTTPCCYHNQCAKKSVEDCVCVDCYDLRHMKHAEYSTWIPSHPECPYKEHSSDEACAILNGTSILFVGDSLIRHVYLGMLHAVTGDMKNGAIIKNAQKTQRMSCGGMYMFTGKDCLPFIKKDLHGCNGTVDLKLLYYVKANSGSALKKVVMSMKEKSIIFTGIGIHDGLNETLVKRMFLKPTLTYMKSHNQTWPRFIWATTHAVGMLKSPAIKSQTYDRVKRYNAKMKPFLESWNVPIFDTFNLTDGMMSFDGMHFGLGMNMVKANILLSYIQELRANQNW